MADLDMARTLELGAKAMHSVLSLPVGMRSAEVVGLQAELRAKFIEVLAPLLSDLSDNILMGIAVFVSVALDDGAAKTQAAASTEVVETPRKRAKPKRKAGAK